MRGDMSAECWQGPRLFMIQGFPGLLAPFCSYRKETVVEVEAEAVEGTGLQCTHSTYGCCLGLAGGQQASAHPESPCQPLFQRLLFQRHSLNTWPLLL